MSEIRAYLLRLVLCGFFVSLLLAVTANERIKKLISLGGGCLLLITALGPIVRVDWTALPNRMKDLLPEHSLSAEEAERRNNQLLSDLIAKQTADRIRAEAADLGLRVEVSVRVEKDPEAGVLRPVAVELSGVWTETERQALSDWLEESLELPQERQVWRSQ